MVKKKRGPKLVLPDEHRRAMGLLLKAMGDTGSPMNSVIARPVLKGYMMKHNLMHHFAETPAKKKLSLNIEAGTTPKGQRTPLSSFGCSCT